jgi:bloom syndrome protein
LIYEIREKKGGNVLEDMADWILKFWKNKSGIIYCCTKKSCEEISGTLNSKFHLKTGYYHGAMADKMKN